MGGGLTTPEKARQFAETDYSSVFPTHNPFDAERKALISASERERSQLKIVRHLSIISTLHNAIRTLRIWREASPRWLPDFPM